jgi:uncharacterized glyoxalase superfamily protein PhnB
MNVRKVTPIFVVETITPEAVAFWEKTGWRKLVDVPHGAGVGFVLLENDGREVMLQSRASLRDDLATKDLDPRPALYVDVGDLAEARAQAKAAGARVLIEERETSYGAKETWLVDPAGVLVGYAQLGKGGAS